MHSFNLRRPTAKHHNGTENLTEHQKRLKDALSPKSLIGSRTKLAQSFVHTNHCSSSNATFTASERRTSGVTLSNYNTPSQKIFEFDMKQITNEKEKPHVPQLPPRKPRAIDNFLQKTLPQYVPFLKHYVNSATTRAIDVQELDKNFTSMAGHVFMVWLILSTLSVVMSPRANLVYIHPTAQKAHMTSAILLITNVLVRTSPIILGTVVSRISCSSGSFKATMTVQGIAAATDLIHACFRVPIFIDAITGCEVSLLRWSAWVPLGYAMAYLTDGVDATIPESPFYFGFTNGLSCFIGGFIIPLICSHINFWVWLLAFTISFCLFALLFIRLYYKQVNFPLVPKGKCVEQMETYERFRIGLNLLKVCTCSWSLLVLNYMIAWFVQVYFGGQSSINIISEPFLDLISKNFYLNLNIEAHRHIFDDKTRAERRLEELRCFMSTVWNTSTDLMVISIGGISGDVKTQLSPALEKLIRTKNPLPPSAFEFVIKDYELRRAKSNPGSERSGPLPTGKDRSFMNISDHVSIQRASGIRDLVLEAWVGGDDSERVFNRCLIQQDGTIIHCEAKVTRLNKYSLVLVVRNITERYQRFEAEKKVVSLVTARKKDEEANNFTRHEVKNGILAAIGLCDGISESIAEAREKQKQELGVSSLSDLALCADMVDDNLLKLPRKEFVEKIDDLSVTLQETLNMVVTETVGRDLINGVYVPRFETLNLCEIFSKQQLRHPRFFVDFNPPLEDFPKAIILDPQILHYIHRNAFTNACKYGKKLGDVRTVFRYDFMREMLELSVINEPGPFHDRILKLGRHAKELVFTPGKRLHTSGEDTSKVRVSSGDGAWIMRNCARALNGNCDYHFEAHQTVFTFVCPAKLALRKGVSNNDLSHTKIFPLPPNTWGIAIDDSKVQRKLLGKLLQHTGITSDKIIVQGGTAQEIQNFDKFVIDLVKQRPTDLFIIIADENMDMAEDEKFVTVSGSMLIQNIIQTLPQHLEKQTLTLVRSANDSSADIAKYEARAHGFLNKAPISKSKVEKLLTPLWVKRFGNKNYGYSSDDMTPLNSAATSLDADNDITDSAELDMETELKNSVSRIDVLINSRDEYTWILVKELLHSLKGDLMTYSTNKTCIDAMDLIDMIRHSKHHDEFVAFKWVQLKELVMALVLKIKRDCTYEALAKLYVK